MEPGRARENIPRHCRPEAYETFCSQLDRLDHPEGLCKAASAIALHEMPETDVQATWDRIAGFRQTLRTRVPSGNARALHAHAHELLFSELGFSGNTTEYYDSRNSYLPCLLKTRRGLPITLSLLYKCVLDSVGVPVTGLNAPGHFLVRVKIDDDAMIVDPFHGGKVLNREEAFQTIEKVVAASVPRSDNLLPVATPRAWLSRMLQNLQAVFRHANRTADAGAVLELQQVLMRPRPSA